MSLVSDDKKSSDLDLTNLNRGVWLVKVPKYIATRWEKAQAKTEVGKLLISKGEDGKPEIKFNLSEELLKIQVEKPNQNSSTSTNSNPTSKTTKKNIIDKPETVLKPEDTMITLGAKPKNSLIGVKKDVILKNKDELKNLEIPKEHEFAISDISYQHLAVFSQSVDEKNNKKLILEGNVVQKGECRPIADSRYMDLKKQRIVEARQPTRLVKQLDKAVVNYKPLITVRAETETKRKNEQKKSRENKDKVTEILFAAFEKHQYYYLKDLEKITKQPITYLKEILREIANYNLKNPHKNMWELKKEFRHYNNEKE